MTDDPPANRDTALFIALVLGGLVVFAAAVAVGAALDAKPGSLAEWVAGVSTFAALLAASYAAIKTSGMLRIEQRRDYDREQARRQAQAQLIAVWPGPIRHDGPEVTHVMGGNQPETVTRKGVCRPGSIPIHVRNASALPVYDLSIEVYIGDPEVEPTELAGSVQLMARQEGSAVIDSVGPLDIATPKLIASMTDVIGRRPRPQVPSTVRIGWSFRDNAGVRWRRYPDGRLAEVKRET